MLSQEERRIVYEKAYVPEHLVDYVVAVSKAEPYILEGYLFYHSGRHLNAIGYPLEGGFSVAALENALDTAVRELKADSVSVIAQELPAIEKEAVMKHSSDSYYFIDLKSMRKGRKLRNLLKRAGREVKVSKEAFESEHRGLVEAFLSQRNLGEESRYIMEKLPEYLSRSRSAVLFASRSSDDELAAFSVFDYGSKNCVFYMFSFHSKEHYVPGASDLLLDHALNHALKHGKKRVNMGLGVNKGVSRFKEKWGAKSELNHEFLLYSQELRRLMDLSRRLGV